MSARHVKTDFTGDTKRRGFVSVIYEYAEAVAIAMVLLVILFTFCFRVAGVKGSSMEPTLHNGDRLVLNVHFYEPAYGDIVIVKRYTQDPLVKRVIGIAGDTIRIDEASGHVYRNGAVLKEPYIMDTTTCKDLVEEVTVPEGYIFVMGDNRGVSKDSRSAEIGMVDMQDVVGKAILRVWPFRKIGLLE